MVSMLARRAGSLKRNDCSLLSHSYSAALFSVIEISWDLGFCCLSSFPPGFQLQSTMTDIFICCLENFEYLFDLYYSNNVLLTF